MSGQDCGGAKQDSKVSSITPSLSALEMLCFGIQEISPIDNANQIEVSVLHEISFVSFESLLSKLIKSIKKLSNLVFGVARP